MEHLSGKFELSTTLEIHRCDGDLPPISLNRLEFLLKLSNRYQSEESKTKVKQSTDHDVYKEYCLGGMCTQEGTMIISLISANNPKTQTFQPRTSNKSKMSIVCTEIENPPNWTPTPRLRVTIDPKSKDKLPFPSDYKYFSCCLPKKFMQCIDRVQNFEVRPDDIWILGFPKSGTTWAQNIVYQLKIKCMNFEGYFNSPDIDYFDAPLFFEYDGDNEEIASYVAQKEKMLDELDALPSPRMIKSHLPAYLLPKQIWTVQPKLVYISRNAKDTAVSYYHMSRNNMIPNNGTMSDFLEYFRNYLVIFGPFHHHFYSFHQLRHFKHLFLLTYEDLSANTFENVKRMSEFLGCSYSDEQLYQLINYVSFGKMRENNES